MKKFTNKVRSEKASPTLNSDAILDAKFIRLLREVTEHVISAYSNIPQVKLRFPNKQQGKYRDPMYWPESHRNSTVMMFARNMIIKIYNLLLS